MLNGMGKSRIAYKIVSGIPTHDLVAKLLEIYTLLFEDADVKYFKERFNMHPKITSILAYDGENVIGFKIGYPYKNSTFYSWIGGVLPEYRGLGIASNLSEHQEIHARKQGCIKLRTKSMNQFKPMMILNLKQGFDIVETYSNEKGQKKIIFEKNLSLNQ